MSNVDSQIEKLAEKYQFKSHLGDQCLYSLLSLEYPELFYNLPCGYNYQLDTTMDRQVREQFVIWILFKYCDFLAIWKSVSKLP